MKLLSASQVHATKVKELGLDPTEIDLTSIEAIANALRRASEFLCPCSTSTLVRAVINPLRGLVKDTEEIRAAVEETLEAIIAHGDILEQRIVSEDGGDGALLLYCAPPSFVMRDSGGAILIGPSSSVLPDALQNNIRHLNHVRKLEKGAGENLSTILEQLGMLELTSAMWLKAPSVERPSDVVKRIDRSLDGVSPSRDVPGLILLDPERSHTYYRGRWVEPDKQTGRFVARRRQAYGMDLWCYVEMSDGQSQRLLDFPFPGSRWRGCDEAWRVQMALDAIRGVPQGFVVTQGPAGTKVFKFFSPVPLWARRRWDAVGEPASSAGCLFAYKFISSEVEEEIKFAEETLWLRKV